MDPRRWVVPVIPYIIAGLVIGGIYAMSAAGIVVTYISTGVLNFAFASLAYSIARLYYYLHVQQDWGILAAALTALVIVAPLLGVLMYLALFRLLRQATTLTKVIATVGLSVSLPPLCTVAFGTITVNTAPGLAPAPVHVFHLLGTTINLDQVIAYACVVAVLVGGVAVLRFTDAGLRVRAMVDSEAMTSLSAINVSRVSVGVWAVSIFLAGLAGVLSAPIIGLDPNSFQLLVAAAFAAVVAARLRNIGVAVAAGFAMGIIGALIQWLLPPSSDLARAVVPSVPFLFIAAFLAYQVIRSDGRDESLRIGGALDRAIRPQGGTAAAAVPVSDGRSARHQTRSVDHALRDPRNLGYVFTIVVMAVLPLVLSGFWVGLVGETMAVAVIFLSITLVTGQGGMIWLCQITFAAVGAIATAQLATNHGFALLLAVVVGGLIAAAMGAVISVATVRLGDLYVALVTLAFALLMADLVFTRTVFYQQGVGVTVYPPSFAGSPRSFSYFAIVAFLIVGLLVYNLRVSTPGLAASAVRSSVSGARSIGLSVVQTKVMVSTIAAFIAGVGGGLLAIYSQAALPDSFPPFMGLVWLAVVATNGLRSNSAAVVAAASYIFLPAIVLTYVTQSWVAQLPTVLFGLGAIFVASNPDGALAVNAQYLESLVRRLRRPTPIPAPVEHAARAIGSETKV